MGEQTRRTFLKKAIRITATALGMAAAVFGGHALLRTRRLGYPANRANRAKFGPRGVRLIRPPGAVEEDKSLAGCIRCYRCQDACELGAIQFFSEAYGRHYHTPYVNPSLKACTICMKCTQVCPTGVLVPMEMRTSAM